MCSATMIFIKPSSLISIFLLATLIVSSCLALYQDQVGKFDWRKQFIGVPKFVYHNAGSDNIIVGTHSNVIASIHSRDGSIIWRQLLSNDCQLNLMSVLKSSEDSRDFLVKSLCKTPANSGVPSKDHSYVWNPQTGLLVSESRYKEFLDDDQAESIKASEGHLVGTSRAFPITESLDLVVDQGGLVSYKAHDRIIWSREESLASVVAVDIVKLPTDLRDKFGMKKTIVTVTEQGKIFGIDTLTGDIIWHIFDKDFAATNRFQSSHINLILLKQTDQSADDFRALVIHPKGLLLDLNPITGEIMEKINLSSSIKQIAPTELTISQEESEQSRGVILWDTKDNIHIYPKHLTSSVQENLHKYYITLAEKIPSASLSGYRLISRDGTIKPDLVWQLPFNATERIVNLSIKRVDEETHSPARVLGDRGILYKYVNPNVIALMTEGTSGDSCTPEQTVNVYLVDGVTGALVHSVHHQKSRGPTRMVHSENWLVYSYFNTKTRRTEVSSLEMFEGTAQVNSTAFSSLTRSHIKPKLIEHRSFIFPSGIEALVDTTTLRGMTNRHIIVALPSGSLLEIPKIFLDPRRPTNMTPEHREEGLIPYMPELPIPSESMINYDKTLLSVKGLVSSPAMLESTSLIFSYGLDLFFTRVTPSKTFDILKDDFDHLLISAVLIFLVVASWGTKYLAQRKALHAAWK